ncbi:glutamate--tRNA ligase, partial [Patescibacteria group bacterium]|nr:glutamate--tRNA ligase [Patescibacteria group bacterium]
MKARTRIAPSPTGYVHIGTLRTALYNYFLAKQTGGEFIIRIEDTDQQRLVEGSVENLLGVFYKLSITHDEGPMLQSTGDINEKGEYGPYIQSKRLPIYKQYVERLIEQGDAYYCFCTKERLDSMRAEQVETKQTPKYDRACLRLSKEEIQAKIKAGERYVVRLKVPGGHTTIKDAIRGEVTFQNSQIDDQVLLKSDGFPTYHMAVVVDDALMEITHVIRGEEWLPSTPKHVMLYKMLGFTPPIFAHLPLLLNPDKSKLSKRQGDVSVEDFLTKGYVKDALLNFVALLGFNPKGDQEIYELKELIDLFDLTKVNKSGAVLNIEKLDWMNSQYIQKMTFDSFVKVASDFTDLSTDLLKRAAYIERCRLNRLDELSDKIEPYKINGEYSAQMLVWRRSDATDAKLQLENVMLLVKKWNETDFDTIQNIENKLKKYIETNQLSNGNVLWPLRVALSKKEQSPSPFEMLWILGREESLK